MITIIAGSRSATQAETLRAIRQSGFADKITAVISGDCPPRWDHSLCQETSADHFGEQWANSKGLQVIHYPADWTKGVPDGPIDKSAGPRRNSSMVSAADALIAVRINMSGGTSDVIAKARKKGIPVYVFDITKSKRG